jgi:hypothetical protein
MVLGASETRHPGLIDSRCHTARRLGRDLMRPTKELFVLWQKVRDGTLSRAVFVEQMKPIRAEVESLLLRGYFNARLRGFCKGLWEHRQNLWTFVEVDGVEPTNNAAEQALRQAVIWRKLSFGTQSSAGSRFVERLLTVVETCRRQQRNVFVIRFEPNNTERDSNSATFIHASTYRIHQREYCYEEGFSRGA